MKRKGIVFLLFIIIFFSFLLSDNKAPIDQNLIKIYKDSNGPIFYPDSYIYTLLGKYSISFDNKTKKVEKHYIDFYQILNAAGRDKYSDYKIRFIKGKEKLEVLKAFILNKDLTFVNVEKGAINTVTPLGLEKASLYSNILDRVYSFQSVDPEDAIYIEYNKTKESRKGFIGSIFVFQEENPIREKILEIKLPKNMKLYTKIKNETKEKKIEKKVMENGDFRIYAFKMKDIPKIKPEEYRASDFYISPNITFSTSKNWEKTESQLYNDYEENSKITDNIKEKVKKLTEGLKTKEDKLTEIYKFISSEIKYIPLPLGLDGYSPHKASVVLENGYGDLRDKTVLFMAMLKAIGLRAHPVFVGTWADAEKELVVLSQFNYILIKVNLKGKTLFLDPNGENSVLGYTGIADGTDALMFAKKSQWVKIKNSVPNSVIAEFNININDKNEFKADINIKTSGYFDSIIKRLFKLSSEDEKSKEFSQYANIFNEGAESINYKLKNLKSFIHGAEVNQTIEGKDLYVKQGNIIVLNLPDNPYPFASFPFNISLKERNYPFNFGKKILIKEIWKIKGENDLKPLYLPEKMEINTDKYSFILYSIKKGREITIVREIRIKTKMLNTSEYLKFKKIYDKFNNWKLRTLLLEKSE